jgi:hypothetical protein
MSVVGVSNVSAQQEGDIPVDVTVGTAPGAGLTWTAVETSPFPDVAYSFADQTVVGTTAITVTDSRGTGAGWTQTLSGTDFVGTNTGDMFPIENLVIIQGAVTVLTGDPTPLPVAASITVTESPQQVFVAPPGSGSGRYGVSATSTLLIPGNTQVDTYTSILHISLTSAP